MNRFFRTFWAALLAFVVGSILMAVLTVLVIGGFVAALGQTSTAVPSEAVLCIDLSEEIVDAPSSAPFARFDPMTFSSVPSLSLYRVLSAIEVAQDDDRIKGIYIRPSGYGMIGTAQLEELRAAVVRFKESGKFVIAYSDFYTQGEYWFASVADRVYLNPQGSILWQGLAANTVFYKGLFDKLGVEPEIFRHGTYKAAVEPFITDRMSEANRRQTEALIGSLWHTVLEDVSASRGVEVDDLDTYAARLCPETPQEALELGFVDGVCYEDEVITEIEERIAGQEKKSAVRRDERKITLREYVAQLVPGAGKVSRNKIAIVYADGDIVDGRSSGRSIGGESVSALLEEARTDEQVKAVVLRVNSPGGSALASEVIWHEVQLLRAEKPVIVSMGSYAASGGYYISCPGDVILADRTTLTGSIGVFGMMFNLAPALKEKLGITVDVVRTSPSADLGMPFRSVTPAERAWVTRSIERVYATFIGHVAEGRNMTSEAVDAIGQGRVWSGVDAARIGLVDGFGGLTEALALAVDRAGVGDDYRIVEITEAQTELASVLRGLLGAETRTKIRVGSLVEQWESTLRMIESGQPLQARMPYMLQIE